MPTLNEILENAAVKSLVNKISRGEIVSTALIVLGELALQTRQSAAEMTLPTVSEVANRIAARITEGDPTRMVPTINATGQLFPEQLGPPPLASEAITAVTELARDYAAMGRPLSMWDRRQQLKSVKALLARLMEAESVLAVNNPLSAWFLLLAALGKETSVVIGRNQLCRLPEDCSVFDVFRQMGNSIIEVGTVNYTTVDDYSNALDSHEQAIWFIYPNQFNQTGRIKTPKLAEIAKVAKAKKVPLIVDLALYGLWPRGSMDEEPSAAGCLAAGADAVILRGAGMFGGPSCGVILGKKNLLDKCLNTPFAPAALCDPLILAALEQTLLLYSQPDRGKNSIPVRLMFDISEDNLDNRAKRLQTQIQISPLVEKVEVEVGYNKLMYTDRAFSQIPTRRLRVQPQSLSVDELNAALLKGAPPILGLIDDNCIVLDLQTVLPRQDRFLAEAFEK